MYVLTGVSGYLGSTMAEELLRRVDPAELVFTSRNTSALRQFAERGVRTVEADYDNPESLEEAFAGGKRLLMISGMLVGPHRRRQHQNVVEAARRAGIEHVVYTSYLGAGDPENDALVTLDHRFTEEAIMDSGMGWNFMRNSQYADAMAEEQAAMAVASGKSIGNTADGKVAFVARDDVAAVGVELLLGGGTPNTAYDITGPELLTYAQVGALIQEVSGRDVEIIDLTDEQMYAMWDAIGVPRESTGDFSQSPVPWCSDDMVSFGRAIREGSMAAHTTNVTDLTGRPGITLRELMQRAAPNWKVPAEQQ
jgi:NAD(P)H dehydrogenase (quinone)